jgi:hypothetical protein
MPKILIVGVNPPTTFSQQGNALQRFLLVEAAQTALAETLFSISRGKLGELNDGLRWIARCERIGLSTRLSPHIAVALLTRLCVTSYPIHKKAGYALLRRSP